MAKMNVIAYPYAEALFKLAKQANQENTWLHLLADLAVIATNPDFVSVLKNPKVTTEQIIAIVKSSLKREINGEVSNLIQVLAENNRLLALSEIYVIFREKVLEDQKRSDAVIESAFELSKSDQAELETLLSHKFGKQITTTVSVNPSLIAGIKITVNDKVIDGSVKGRLAALATQLTK